MLKVQDSNLHGTVTIPSSKSAAHRLMIASALSGAPTVIDGRIAGDDVNATAACLSALGAKITFSESSVTVLPLNLKGHAALPVELFASSSGSTLRFLLPVVSALNRTAVFDGEKRLAERPVAELTDVLKAHGAVIGGDKLPLKISGQLQSGEYAINARVSSQYITGLLFALPLLDGDSKLTLNGAAVSESYIGLTLDVLKRFSIGVEKTACGFAVRGGQSYVSPRRVTAEGDWSSACFFAVAGAFSGDVTLSGLDLSSLQGDKIILDVLERAGAKTERTKDAVRVSSAPLAALNFDAENCPDIVPSLAVALSTAKGTSRISGISRLRGKESDRAAETVKLLTAFGIKAYADENVLTICGGKLKAAKITLPDDHRIAMAAAVAACAAEGESVFEGESCVSKSYPDFFADLSKIGGKINV